MTINTDNLLYGSSVAITCTTTGLAYSTTVGRQSTVIVSTGGYVDALITIGIPATTTAAPGANKAAYAYFSGSEDGTNFDGDDVLIGTSTSDSSYTINAASNLRGPLVINVITGTKTYFKSATLSTYFGGVVPRKWAVVIINDTTMTLGTGTAAMSYTPIFYISTNTNA